MQKLIVWLRKPNGERVQVGELLSSEPDPAKGGRLEGEFRYFTDYLSRDDCFALDPIHLPLQTRVFSANRPYAGIHGVFDYYFT